MQELSLFDLVEKGKARKVIKIADLKPINNLKLYFGKFGIILLAMLLVLQEMKKSHKI